MGKQLVLDNREWIDIVDSKGNVTGGFYWNPADLDIVKRYEKVAAEFEKIQLPEGEDIDKMYAISDKVKEQFGVTLEPEVKFLGDFEDTDLQISTSFRK